MALNLSTRPLAGAGRSALRVVVLSLAGAAAACATMPVSAPTPRPAPRPAQNWGGLGDPRIVEPAAPLQCVPFARDASGVTIFGDAHTWWDQAAGRYPRSGHPAPGSVLVLRGFADAQRGHVAVVTAVVSEREIRVDQANWLNRGEITLSVPVLDVSPANDWSAVRVWNIPGGHWGGRVYAAQGFIHAFAFAPTA